MFKNSFQNFFEAFSELEKKLNTLDIKELLKETNNSGLNLSEKYLDIKMKPLHRYKMKRMMYINLTFLFIITTIFIISLASCGPKGHKHGKHGDHGKQSNYELLTKNDIKTLGEHSFDLNNGTED